MHLPHALGSPTTSMARVEGHALKRQRSGNPKAWQCDFSNVTCKNFTRVDLRWSVTTFSIVACSSEGVVVGMPAGESPTAQFYHCFTYCSGMFAKHSGWVEGRLVKAFQSALLT